MPTGARLRGGLAGVVPASAVSLDPGTLLTPEVPRGDLDASVVDLVSHRRLGAATFWDRRLLSRLLRRVLLRQADVSAFRGFPSFASFIVNAPAIRLGRVKVLSLNAAPPGWLRTSMSNAVWVTDARARRPSTSHHFPANQLSGVAPSTQSW